MAVWKPASARPTVVVRGSDSPSADSGPGVNPAPVSAARTEATVAADGPKVDASRPRGRKCRNCADPGVETAVTKAARAAGSRGFRSTSIGNGVVDGAGPSSTAPAGTGATVPMRTIASGRPAGWADAGTAARPGASKTTAATGATHLTDRSRQSRPATARDINPWPPSPPPHR